MGRTSRPNWRAELEREIRSKTTPRAEEPGGCTHGPDGVWEAIRALDRAAESLRDYTPGSQRR